jgi:hypothetical protein
MWVARLAGFEPTTPWFVAKYSIQLSYSRVGRNYSGKTSAAFAGALGGRAERLFHQLSHCAHLKFVHHIGAMGFYSFDAYR